MGGALLAQGERELVTHEPAPADNVALMFERLAKDPAVDVEKLERLIAMQERILAHNAKAEFYADFARMQPTLPTVQERGRTNNGAYATHEDIVEAVRPKLKEFGFALTFRTEFPDPATVKVIGVLAHRSGHVEETVFISKADTSGNKNAIQALGSAQSYGQRYTTRALLNIASREDDDDGKATGAPPRPEKPAPDGYDPWLGVLQGIAENGDAAFEKAWADSKPEYRKHLIDTAPKLLAGMRTKARKAGK